MVVIMITMRVITMIVITMIVITMIVITMVMITMVMITMVMIAMAVGYMIMPLAAASIILRRLNAHRRHPRFLSKERSSDNRHEDYSVSQQVQPGSSFVAVFIHETSSGRNFSRIVSGCVSFIEFLLRCRYRKFLPRN
jgi:hypothetical protein